MFKKKTKKTRDALEENGRTGKGKGGRRYARWKTKDCEERGEVEGERWRAQCLIK